MSSSNFQKTIAYWKNILELKIFNQTEKSVLLGYDENQTKIEFIDIGNLCINNIMILLYILISSNKTYNFIWLGTEINHAAAYGRIAFSIPYAEQPEIQKKIKDNGYKILTDLITLDTPGKTSVRVIILADPVSTIIILYL